jgi:hypothetical protein
MGRVCVENYRRGAVQCTRMIFHMVIERFERREIALRILQNYGEGVCAEL